MPVVLFLSVLLIAACGLIYELIAGTLASYLLGDSVLQFSTVIGTYLFAMGIGSWLSRYLARGPGGAIRRHRAAGRPGRRLLVGAAVPRVRLDGQLPPRALRCSCCSIGMLVGLEIPLLMRILKDRFQFKDLVAHVLTFDYLGALGASLLFPLLLVPQLGLVRSALLFGIINAGVALWSTFLFRDSIGRPAWLAGPRRARAAALGGGMVGADAIAAAADDNLYADEVIFARNTRYQRIVLTQWKDDLRLFLNSHLQFSSRDEYRYHEALVHPGLAALPGARRVLVLGGGDGLAVREILKYPDVEQVTLVDLDPGDDEAVLDASRAGRLNQGSLKSPKVHVINDDAFAWLDHNQDMFDFVVVDFPDPTNYSLGKLYTTAFYRLLATHVSANGFIVVQSTSPLFARQSFWCIVDTLKQAGLQTCPYHVYVPSFGEWGFVLGGPDTYEPPANVARRTCDFWRFRMSRSCSDSHRHAAGRCRAEPAERPGSGAVLRARVEGHRTLSTRRQFLSAALVGLNAKAERSIAGGFVNDGLPLGHQLRDRTLIAAPKQTIKIPVVIVGGGIAGLSAAWRLDKKGFRDFVLLEMEREAGGNSDPARTKSRHFPGRHTTPRPCRRTRPWSESLWKSSAF